MVIERLKHGKANAIPGAILCQDLDLTPRNFSEIVAKERSEGKPICASNDPGRPGYYIAADKKEMLLFCGALLRRINSLTKTLQACTGIAENMKDYEKGDNNT